MIAHNAWYDEAKPRELKVSWTSTKIQSFGDFLDDTVKSIHPCGKYVKVTKSFTYPFGVLHNDGGLPRNHLRDCPIPGSYGLSQHEYVALLI